MVKEEKEKITEEPKTEKTSVEEVSISHPKEDVQLKVVKKEERRYSPRTKPEEGEFEEKVVQIDRITRVVKGGRRIRFRVLVVVGDRNGNVGVAVAKGIEVVTAIKKANEKARKNIVHINLKGTTIPHEVTVDFGGAKVLLKPASHGTGVIAGGAVRAVVEVCGIKDVLSKILGSDNKINNVYATFLALKSLKEV